MVFRALTAMVVLTSAGCQVDSSPAPTSASERMEPELLFMVRNEVFGIRLDGTARQSFGTVGDDRTRAGYPRLLQDGRISVLGGRVGAIYPHTTVRDRSYRQIGTASVERGDGASGVIVHGAPSVVYFATSLYTDGSISSTVLRASTDGQSVEPVGVILAGGLFGPSPDGADHVLMVHSPMIGDDEIIRLDVSGDQEEVDAFEVLARIPFPRVAQSPSRLADGRIVYVQFDLRDPNHVGELWVVNTDGTTRPTGILGVDDALAIGNRVVYEAAGGNQIADLLITDLAHPPQNLTHTEYIAEHLGWAAPELAE
ncbi:MAG: hypothetical protein EXR72_21715 [Myxococcales bacterium]|nr:hypothetical protein [Myxococcales bacterium]